MRLTWLAVALLLLGLAGCTREVPPERARAILQQVQQARHSLTMHGKLTTSIQLRDQQLQSEAEVRRAPGVIQLKYTSGKFAGWQIIEQDGYVWRVSPDGKPSASPVGPESGLGLPSLTNLRVTFAGDTSVANRRAHKYIVRPPEKTQARLVVVIDAETSFPLAMQKYGAGGTLVSETTYREIEYNAAPPQRVTPPAVATQHRHGKPGLAASPTTEQELARELGGPLLKPAYIPAGLQLRGFYARHGRKGVLAETRYSDGVRTLVVAQARIPRQWLERRGLAAGQGGAPQAGMPGERPHAGPWRGRMEEGQKATPGQPQPTGRPGWWQRFRQGRGPLGQDMLRERRGDRIVIVRGDLPPEELRKVLASIPYPPGEEPKTGF